MSGNHGQATSSRLTAAPVGDGAIYLVSTLIAAAVAAAAALVSVTLTLPVWAMFIGWVAYLTRPSPKEGLQSWVCLVIGLGLGAAVVSSLARLEPAVGVVAVPIVVFAVAVVVVLARGLRVLNNLLAYFLGLIMFNAAQLTPSAASIAQLAAASALGLAAGALSTQLDKRMHR